MLTAIGRSIKRSFPPLVFIGLLASAAAGLLTIGLGMDTPWAPWERQASTFFPPFLFTLASFLAAFSFCTLAVVYHTVLRALTIKADAWWRASGALFLTVYGIFSFGSGTVEAAIMLNLLHLAVGVPALALLPGSLREDSSPSSAPRPVHSGRFARQAHQT